MKTKGADQLCGYSQSVSLFSHMQKAGFLMMGLYYESNMSKNRMSHFNIRVNETQSDRQQDIILGDHW